MRYEDGEMWRLSDNIECLSGKIAPSLLWYGWKKGEKNEVLMGFLFAELHEW